MSEIKHYHHNEIVRRSGVNFEIKRVHETEDDGTVYAEGWMIDATISDLHDYSTMVDTNAEIDAEIDNLIKLMIEDGRLAPISEKATRAVNTTVSIRWEYLITIIDEYGRCGDKDAQQELDQLGSEGWELINIVPNLGGWDSEQRAFFKRKKTVAG